MKSLLSDRNEVETGPRQAATGQSRGTNRAQRRLLDPALMRECLKPDFDKSFISFSITGRKYFVLLDAELIRKCFVDNHGNYGYSLARQRILKPVFGSGLIASEGEVWRKSREAIRGVFSSERLNAYSEGILAVCRNELANTVPADSPVLLVDYLSRITFEVLSDTLFSGDLSTGKEALLRYVSQIVNVDGDTLDISLAAYWQPQTSPGELRRAADGCRDIISDIITKRLAKPDEEKPGGRCDILDMLIRHADTDLDETGLYAYLTDNILSFLIAGHETSALAVTWALYTLKDYPDHIERIRREADALAAGEVPASRWHEAAPFTKACLQEGMRLNPPASMITRSALGDDTLATTAVPKGSVVMIATGLLHRLHRYWPEPDKFDPNRFLQPENGGYERFAYLPFGVGPKTCIGSGFATRETVILLSEFLRRFDYTYADDKPPEQIMRVVTRPSNKIPVVLRRRQ